MLVQAAFFGMPPDESLNRWVVSIADSPLAIKLQALGLLKQGLPRKLEVFLDEYIRLWTDAKENTRNNILINGYRSGEKDKTFPSFFNGVTMNNNFRIYN